MATRGRYKKGEQRRAAILQAAIEEFSQHGYQKTSVREIARRVDLTVPGLLHYFSSKEELFLETLRERDRIDLSKATRVVDAFRLGVRHNSEVEGLVRLFAAVLAEAIDPAHPGHGFFKNRYSELVGAISDEIAEGQEAGTVTRAASANMLARLFVAVVDGMQTQWLLDRESTDMVEAFDAFWRLLRREGDEDGASSAVLATGTHGEGTEEK